MPPTPQAIPPRAPPRRAGACATDPLQSVRAWPAARDPGLLADDIAWSVSPDRPAGGDDKGRAAIWDDLVPAPRAPSEGFAATEGGGVALGTCRGRESARTFRVRCVRIRRARLPLDLAHSRRPAAEAREDTREEMLPRLSPVTA